ncbi:TerC family protein [Ramlibacter alkalitolerans]|uniref:TerC family protein n=1 Tax=Ramlibacter alkalitolerans TaxID=2039631 RepID=A0ABS1JTD4_9BURK|nr:TerC family protein [Ramlibacter alkalitolerans]MBL0427514.1 TerC family protein [Ramlibacter alkalitolerans]
MTHPPLVWELSVALIVAMLLFDYFFHIRKAHVPTLPEAARWSAAYVAVALLFGGAVFAFGGTELGIQYFAGYLTEKALSIDNVFVFLVILSSFKVPREDQQKALLIGIVISLLARAGFIFVGAALIEHFAWVFYIFGVILLLTAGHMLAPERHEDDEDSTVLRLARTLLPTTGGYDGDKLFTMEDGKRRMTPMVSVIVALGLTDIVFALDSIPAIFGLTDDVFIVFTATAFSLLGLRQLFFLVEGLLERLLYLSYGLATILAFIGVKLVLHALHENNVPFINDGAPVNVIEISPMQSLVVIVAILAVTVLLSLLSPRGKARSAVSRLRHTLAAWQDLDAAGAAAEERAAAYAKLADAEQAVRALPEEYRALIHERQTLREMLADAHARQAAQATGAGPGTGIDPASPRQPASSGV